MSTSQALKSRELYTVGWIAALPKELSAAIAMFDEQHDKPLDFEKHSSDSNSYHCGRIGNHNVVVACLPHGIYGTTSAATTASSMLFSFPNVKVGLMVGIGAAIPSDANDIRLGDVVVSLPHGRSGGVIQYDLGKNHVETASGSDHVLHVFERRGTLNTPPQALLNATGSLEARARIDGHQFPGLLQDMLRRHPRMGKSKPRQPGYVYQGQEKDRLFQASYPHMSGLGCKDCDPALEISRDAREDPLIPEVHYGVIASGNRLIKDALERDMIAKDSGEDCLCLETEAAGLMNSFPCLVIRGICDYADSHKNDDWQEYAAATAAVYAKELLSYLDSADVTQTSRAIEVIEQLSEDVHKIRGILNDVAQTVDETQADATYHKVLGWLSAPDYFTNYHEALEQRQEGTGLWFIQGKAFQRWKEDPHVFTWLHGLSGCGKTVLSSAIIEALKQENTAACTVLYFFFDFRNPNKQSLDGLLRSLITQLYQQVPNTRLRLVKIWRSQTEEIQRLDYSTIFETMACHAGRVRIILDAIDEAPSRRHLLDWITSSVDKKAYDFQLMVLSRMEEDIESAFLPYLVHQHKIQIQKDVIDRDIYAYVNRRVHHDKTFGRWGAEPRAQRKIVDGLTTKASGMFRWVVCQFAVIEKCLDYPSLSEALDTLPKTLEGTYERMLKDIPEVNFPHATTLLNMLIWSDQSEPLKLKEIVDAIAVRADRNIVFDPINRMPHARDVLRICSGLTLVDRGDIEPPSMRWARELAHARATLQPWPKDWEYQPAHASGKVSDPMEWTCQLAHASVKEYLISSRVLEKFRLPLKEEIAKTNLAKMCLAYLSSPGVDTDTINKFHLTRYSAKWWSIFAMCAAPGDRSLHMLMTKFFKSDTERFARICSLTEPQASVGTALYYASYFGLEFGVQDLLKRGVDTNILGGEYGRPLQAASVRNHTRTVQILLAGGADVDGVGGKYCTAVHAASSQGHFETVQVLINAGAMVGEMDAQIAPLRPGWRIEHSPLSTAHKIGHTQMLGIILNTYMNDPRCASSIERLSPTLCRIRTPEYWVYLWKRTSRIAPHLNVEYQGGQWTATFP
ncbi:Pfs, NACHT and ankyrin domain protein [Aureobasidium pullulans]|nr:Pfs, NACHT and ankyrin domain protein [Aureobasidium pullulans]THY00318.1 Pfs, NACHT and ankyrin domain protein [Aureobasidium pullulans]THY56639.1 Pfs, NACHT and ankyrin domain protein [Aureobasidium pullulans]THY58931.1 Pfs, NACHT and ankyrin domain protein [Aureobasidium pullulans]